MVALSYRQIKRNPKRVSNIELFTNKYNWDGSKVKKFDNNNPAIALNVLHKKENMEICLLIFQNITQHMKTTYSQ